MDASTWALIIVTGVGALTAPIALAGYFFGKRTRAEDKAQEFGRMEGWADRDGNRRGGGDDLSYSLGGLSQNVKNIREDIDEIRKTQEKDREDRQALRENFGKMEANVGKMQSDIAALRRSLQDITRKLNFSKRGVSSP